jgi:ferredoxin
VRLAIDPVRCQGHGRCVLISDELFDVNDNSEGVVLVPEPDAKYEPVIIKAVQNCPESAISYS